mgnify:FL=1
MTSTALEIKSQLAKLLATEDIVVEHKQVETASFNVGTRVLTLPLWEKASSVVYDMLVAHEVGHALFTPDIEWWVDTDIPHGVVNVVEDARIEKLMKRKYLGIPKTFYRGYHELHGQDFFRVADLNIDEMNLADRANLFYKIGNFIDIDFIEEEQRIINQIDAIETFEDTLRVAKILNDYCQQEMDRKGEDSRPDDSEQLVEMEQGSGDSGSGEGEGEETKGQGSDSDNGQEEADSREEDRVSDDSAPVNDTPTSGGGLRGSNDRREVEVTTAQNLEENLKELVNHTGGNHVYVSVPKVNLDTVIIDNDKIHEYVDHSFNTDAEKWLDYIKGKETTTRYDHRTGEFETVELNPDVFLEVDKLYREFKNSAKKEVSYLVKEFECKKAADSYARSSTARTGVLDTAKLHTYKFNEDIFKKVTVVPDGKNHGLIFILDWSGSMNWVMQDTLKQLYNLIWFCRKVNIPFEVYAFTNEWHNGSRRWDDQQGKYITEYELEEPKAHCERVEKELYIDDRFALLNMLTSNVNAKTLDHQMLNIWRLADRFSSRSYGFYNVPARLNLSGTPLNEALVSLHQIIPHFQKVNKVQKVQCVILTDGEAGSIPYNRTVERRWEDEPYMGTNSTDYGTVFLRDRKVGRTYRLKYGYNHFTNSMLENLKDRFPSTNFIGIRLVNSREGMQFARAYAEYGSKEMQQIEKDWKKTKSFNIKSSGYDAYFGLSSNALSADDEFTVKEEATKAEIKRAFAKSLKVKKLNKRVLSEFIELVA